MIDIQYSMKRETNGRERSTGRGEGGGDGERCVREE